MEPRFEKMESFELVGCPQYANPGKIGPGLAWGRLFAIKKAFDLSDPEEEYAVEVYPPDFPQNDFTFYYMAGIPSSFVKKEMRRVLFVKEIQQAEYAVFPVADNDPAKVKDAFQYAYREWLPSSGYEATLGYDLERYRYHPEKCFEVMIPVRKKRV
jgi:predicted transcriptional regulator YdeE